MKPGATKNLEKLLDAGKQEEARAYLRELLSAPLSDEEQGALLVGFAAAYLALSNHANRTYFNTLEEEVSSLEEVETLEKQIQDKLGLVKIRRELLD